MNQLKRGDRIPCEIEVTEWDARLGCWHGRPVTGDWFLSEDGDMVQTPKHWDQEPPPGPHEEDARD